MSMDDFSMKRGNGSMKLISDQVKFRGGILRPKGLKRRKENIAVILSSWFSVGRAGQISNQYSNDLLETNHTHINITAYKTFRHY